MGVHVHFDPEGGSRRQPTPAEQAEERKVFLITLLIIVGCILILKGAILLIESVGGIIA